MENYNNIKILFLISFFRLIQVVKFHTDNNFAIFGCLTEFLRIIEDISGTEKYLRINISGGRIYFQEEKVFINRENENVIKRLVDFFEEKKISGFEIMPQLALQNKDEILKFIRILNLSEKQKDASIWIERQLNELNIKWIEILKVDPSKKEVIKSSQKEQDENAFAIRDFKKEQRESAKNSYVNSIDALKEISNKANSERPCGIRKILRTVQGMIDLILEDDFVFFGLSTIRDYDDYTYVHSVNVAILSMSIGSRIGLPRNALEALGICGMFHDLGKVKIPKEIVNKPDKLTPAEYEQIKKHSLDSVRMILLLKASRDLLQEILIGPFEHHLKYDLSGYPQTDRKKPLSLYGRIISIADVYDALTSPRVYRKAAISPDQALNIMIKDSGKMFDPTLLKIFVNMMGIYPVGSLLKLSSGEFGLVIKSPENKDPMRPRVMLLNKISSNRFTKGRMVDLSEKSIETGNYLREISGSYHPGVLGIQPAEYII
jgi:HD-GYP domain-containing protein (c-di-GMP phosphodiesterase class II)